MNFSNYDRLFSFGCSFTDYRWPTWADIIDQESEEDKLFNYGGSGYSNIMISREIFNADLIHKFTKNDLILISWTDICREERFFNGRINGTGNIFGNYPPLYQFKNVNEVTQLLHQFYVRDLTIITAVESYLNLKNIEHVMFSTVPLSYSEEGKPFFVPPHIADYFIDINKKIKYNFFETIFNSNWTSVDNIIIRDTNGQTYKDTHPSPLQHLDFLKKIFPDIIFSNKTLNYVKYYDNILRKDGGYDAKLGAIHPKKIVKRII